MKKITIIGLTLLLLAGNTLATKLVLGEADGLAGAIEVSSYDGKTKTVKYRLGTVSTNGPLADFPSSVQEKIMAWQADTQFESSRMKVVFTQRGRQTQVSYRIGLENRASVPFEDLRVTYRMFFESEFGESEIGRMVSGSKDLALFSGDTKYIETEKVRLRDESIKIPTVTGSGSRTEYGYTLWPQSDRFLGICVSIEKEGMAGGVLIRDFYEGRAPKRKKWDQYKPS